MTLYGIIGNLGAGKTLLLTAMLHELRLNHLIVTNYWTSFSNTIMNAEEMILRIEEFAEKNKNGQNAFGIDELGSILKALEFYSDENELLTDIARKSRKKGTDIYYTTQHLMMVDRNIRRITDVFIHVSFDLKTETVKGQSYMFDGLNIFDDDPFRLKDASRFYDMFDTNEVIEPDRTAVLRYFVDKASKCDELHKDLESCTNQKLMIDVIKFHMKCSVQLAKMLFIRKDNWLNT